MMIRSTKTTSYYRHGPPKSCQERRRPRSFASKFTDAVLELREKKVFLQHNPWEKKESQPCAQCIQYAKGGDTFVSRGLCCRPTYFSLSLSCLHHRQRAILQASQATLVARLPRFSLVYSRRLPHSAVPIESQNTNRIFGTGTHRQSLTYLS